MARGNETERLLRLLSMLTTQLEIAQRHRWQNDYTRGIEFGLMLAIGELREICDARLRQVFKRGSRGPASQLPKVDAARIGARSANRAGRSPAKQEA